MHIKKMISSFSINSEFKDSVSDKTKGNSNVTFNEKKVKIVVAARQYPCGAISARGYGDIASGVRGLEYLIKIYPSAKFSFVVEHCVYDEIEFAKIKTMTTIPEVKTFILNGRKKDGVQSTEKTWNQEHQKDAVNQLLQDADFIFHGPSGLIAPLKYSQGEYAQKTVGVLEYDRNSGYYSESDPHGIASFDMGLRYNRIYIMQQSFHESQFKDNVLRTHCLNPITESEVDNDKNKFYFHYGHSIESLAQMVRVMVLIEGDCDRNIILVSPIDFHTSFEIFKQKDFENLLLESCQYQIVKICRVKSNGEYVELIMHENPQGQHVKKIRLITPDILDNNDFKLLQKGSVINYTSGDISTSDVLSLGKIPIFGIYSKKCLYTALETKMTNFCMIEGNEQYQALIEIWNLAVFNFTRQGKFKLLKASLAKINSLQQLRGLKWQEFERKFTDWLQENNQTESFIRNKAEAIIARNIPSTLKE